MKGISLISALKAVLNMNLFLALLAISFLLLVPVLIRDPYIWGILIIANVYAAFGTGFNLLLGYTGLAVLGFGVFVGLGAYMAAALNLLFGWPPWLTMPVAGLTGALGGLFIGIPCLRLRGLYLALATFAVAGICEKLLIVFSEFTHGREGLSGLTPISLNRVTNYYASLLLLLIFTVILFGVVKSKFGLILRSIYNDQTAAEAVGINVNRYKLFAFLIGSSLGGFWGGFFAHFMTHIGPEVFGLRIALTIFMVTIVGGIGTIIGPIGGAYLLILTNELLREIGDIRLLIYSVFTIVVYLLLPQGIMPPVVRSILKMLNYLASYFPMQKILGFRWRDG